MKRTQILLPALLLAVAGGAFGFIIQSKKIRQIERELDWVRKELKSPGPATASVPRGEEIPVDDDYIQVENAPVMGELPAAGYATEPVDSFNPAIITPETLETLQYVVKDQVKEEMAKLKKKKGAEVSVKYLAKELELDTYTQERLSLFYNECKDRGLALLSAPREDGGNFMDDFIQAETSGTGGKEVWGRLFSDRVPGTDQTYFQRLMEIGAETTRNIETLLTPEQIEGYGTYDIDPFKVNTGYDPFEEYGRQRSGN